MQKVFCSVLCAVDDVLDRILPPAAKTKEEKSVKLWKNFLIFLSVMGPGHYHRKYR